MREFFPRSKSNSWHLRAYPRLIEKGYIGFLIHDSKEWAAVQWVATPESPGPPHLSSNIAAKHYWAFYEHTRKGHRQLGLWRTLKAFNISYIRNSSDDPSTPIYSDTSVVNLASRHAHHNFGFQPAGTISRVSIRVPRLTTLNWGSWEKTAPHPPITP